VKQKRTESSGFFESIETPLGRLYLVFFSGFLAGIYFERPEGKIPKKIEDAYLAKKELKEYFEGERRDFTCQTSFQEGTDFEKEVWLALKDIPYGETRTYKWLAEKIGKPQAFRAVGNALGKNPIPVIFPCHRIIESDGSIGGYSSGLEIKRRLLELEYYTRLSKG
jgi:methylated-DNA-[protein]-cysteine S-methyltransferase